MCELFSSSLNKKKFSQLIFVQRCKPPAVATHKKNRHQHQAVNSEVNHKRERKNKKKSPEEDPYIADDEDEDYNGKKRRSVEDRNRLVMKVVKQGDYQHKQSFDRSSGGLGDIEQEFFLPRNLSFLNMELKSQRWKGSDDDEDDFDSDFDEDYEAGIESDTKTKTVKAVFEMPRKPLANYSKWSRWSKCSSKCVTRRYKKCRPHARQICGNDIIREIAYCYTEGSFCEEWISSQISKIGAIEAQKTTTTKAPPRVSRRTESPLVNSVSQDFYGASGNGSGSRRKPKVNLATKPQNFQCGFPSIRNKNNDFALKIIGGKTSRRAQVKNLKSKAFQTILRI